MTVVVYSKPACVQCDATYRRLDKFEIEYTIIDISVDTEALQKLVSLGVQQAPYVEVTHADGRVTAWTGYNPGQIKELASL